MKRFLMLAAMVGVLTCAATTRTAEAHPRHVGFGGGGYYGAVPGYGYSYGVYQPQFLRAGYGAYYNPGVYFSAPGLQIGYGSTYVAPVYGGYNGGYGCRTYGW